MRPTTLMRLFTACLMVLGALFIFRSVLVQSSTLQAQTTEATRSDSHHPPHPTPSPQIYNPYPPGILPADLNTEIARVLREIDVIEARALVRSQALLLQPPILTGQPPILQNTGTEAVEILGELMNYDQNISPNRNQACASCHMPYAAFSGPIPSVNLTMIAYPGTVHFRAGKRTAQRYTYSPFFPVLQFNEDTGSFLWRKLLGFTRDRIFAAEPRRRTGAGSSGRYPGNGHSRTLLASRSGFRSLCTDLCLSWYGVRAPSISICQRTRRRSAQPLEEHQFGGNTTPVNLSRGGPHSRQTTFITTGRSPLAHTSSLCRSAPSRRNSTPC